MNLLSSGQTSLAPEEKSMFIPVKLKQAKLAESLQQMLPVELSKLQFIGTV
jgi:hypothetical protein